MCLFAAFRGFAGERTAVLTETTSIYVVRRGWHIDVGFAVDNLAEPIKPIADQFPGARYIFFGFGDKRYLESRRRGAPAMLAALWPGPGLLLATALSATPAAAFGAAQVVELRVSRPRANDAQSRVWGTLSDVQQRRLAFAKVGEPDPVSIPGPYAGSLFFDTRYAYSAVHTCNTWAMEILKGAGLPVHSGGVLFAGQVWRQIGKLAIAQRAEPDRPPSAGPAAAISTAVACRSGKPRWWNRAEPPQWSSPVRAGCCC